MFVFIAKACVLRLCESHILGLIIAFSSFVVLYSDIHVYNTTYLSMYVRIFVIIKHKALLLYFPFCLITLNG